MVNVEPEETRETEGILLKILWIFLLMRTKG